MIRRSLLGALAALPAALLVRKAVAQRVSVAKPAVIPPPSWFCFSCGVRGDAVSADDARNKLLSHCRTGAHFEKLDLMTRNQVLKGQIKRRRRDGPSVDSGFAAWRDGLAA